MAEKIVREGLTLEIGPGTRPFIKNAVKLEKNFYFFGQKGEADVIGLATQLPFKNNAFDFIVTRHVLEHVANPILMIREMKRALAQAGQIMISVPNKYKTFDLHRKPTSFLHLLKDYILNRKDNDKSHAWEWVRKVLLNKDARKFRTYQSEEANHKEYLKFLADLRANRNLDIHFHVFDSANFRRLFSRLNKLRLIRLKIQEYLDPDPSDSIALTIIVE